MSLKFAIRAWAACAPGLTEATAWQAWAQHPHLPQGQASPPLHDMPAMLRRRLEPLGRMALRSAYDCQPAEAVPVVFASRHGDAARACTLLHELVRHAPLSPTDFSLSVHNAVAALYSIARQDRSPYSALAAGPLSPEAAVTEALGLLQDGHREVVIVIYDTPLPATWSSFADGPECAFAWAWRLGLPAPGEAAFTLQSQPAPATTHPASALPHALDVLRFFLSHAPSLEFSHRGCLWRWQRHA